MKIVPLFTWPMRRRISERLARVMSNIRTQQRADEEIENRLTFLMQGSAADTKIMVVHDEVVIGGTRDTKRSDSMNLFLFWLYGWHYLVHNLLTFTFAKDYCDTCQAWEDERSQRVLKAHERQALKIGGTVTGRLKTSKPNILVPDCDSHPDGCEGYVYHTGTRSDAPREERE